MRKSGLSKFKFHWLDGTTQEAEGTDIADAFRRAGYGGGAIRALDYWEPVKTNSARPGLPLRGQR